MCPLSEKLHRQIHPLSIIPFSFRDALEYAHRQLFISEELDNPNMRAESYLNLARAHQRLGGLERYVTRDFSGFNVLSIFI